jgi:hypothetical protein
VRPTRLGDLGVMYEGSHDLATIERPRGEAIDDGMSRAGQR